LQLKEVLISQLCSNYQEVLAALVSIWNWRSFNISSCN